MLSLREKPELNRLLSPPTQPKLLFSLWQTQLEKHRRFGGIHGNDVRCAGRAAGHIHPVGRQTGIQTVGLGLQNPAEMIGWPGECQRAAGNDGGDIGRIGGHGADYAQYPVGWIKTPGQIGAGLNYFQQAGSLR